MAGPLSPYRPRQVEWLGLRRVGRFTLKFYLVRAEHRAVSDDMAAAAGLACDRFLSGLPASSAENGIGFAILHLGEHANWLLVDRWIHGDSLANTVLRSTLDEPERFERVADPDLCFCVWEGGIVDFERRAFIETMMTERSDVERYLAVRPPKEV